MARDFRDISPLRGMTNIKKLEIGHNPLVYGHSQIDIESLSYMTQLEELTLYDYQDRFNGNVGAAALSNLVN